ncbi:hypothetical protein [Leptospira vanthielii]|uniref:DUF115 domain-containing protein n=1 Tax=Leptospira vanthielii TaxID=293085 RepID=A0ABY2NSV2_9LEPT|nr:hypothetical protein [Leptospira vanthielii]TGM60705.1 hypothetical protein EHQ95_02170 [Leptospira vanthielii]
MKKFIKNSLVPCVADPILRKIKKFKNIHQGQECYIFGDGSSLKYFDLSLFSDKISIPVAYLPFHKDFHLLNVPYAFCIEPFWFYPFNKVTIPPYNWKVNEIQRLYHKVIKDRQDIQFFLNLSNWPTVREKNVTYIYNDWIDSELPMDHFSRKFNRYLGSLRGAISNAIYMGFTKIYLVGFDYTHRESRLYHWYEKGIGETRKFSNYEREFLSAAKNYAEIVTVTIDGNSEVLDSITYTELTGVLPKFNDNDVLLPKETLGILATWPDYHIF